MDVFDAAPEAYFPKERAVIEQEDDRDIAVKHMAFKQGLLVDGRSVVRLHIVDATIDFRFRDGVSDFIDFL